MLTLSIHSAGELHFKLDEKTSDDQLLIFQDKKFLSSAKIICEESLGIINAHLNGSAINSAHIPAMTYPLHFRCKQGFTG